MCLHYIQWTHNSCVHLHIVLLFCREYFWIRRGDRLLIESTLGTLPLSLSEITAEFTVEFRIKILARSALYIRCRKVRLPKLCTTCSLKEVRRHRNVNRNTFPSHMFLVIFCYTIHVFSSINKSIYQVFFELDFRLSRIFFDKAMVPEMDIPVEESDHISFITAYNRI
jgi:hypothetical protein